MLFACQPANNKFQLSSIQQQHSRTTTTFVEENKREVEHEEPSTPFKPEIKSPANQFTRKLGGYNDTKDTDNIILLAANKFLSFKKLVKVFAFVPRFVSGLKQTVQVKKEFAVRPSETR